MYQEERRKTQSSLEEMVGLSEFVPGNPSDLEAIRRRIGDDGEILNQFDFSLEDLLYYLEQISQSQDERSKSIAALFREKCCILFVLDKFKTRLIYNDILVQLKYLSFHTLESKDEIYEGGAGVVFLYLFSFYALILSIYRFGTPHIPSDIYPELIYMPALIYFLYNIVLLIPRPFTNEVIQEILDTDFEFFFDAQRKSAQTQQEAVLALQMLSEDSGIVDSQQQVNTSYESLLAIGAIEYARKQEEKKQAEIEEKIKKKELLKRKTEEEQAQRRKILEDQTKQLRHKLIEEAKSIRNSSK